ncbi:putative membrane protein [Yersinia pestis PY-13]|uniref:Uncharacterized protein n=7 Tax=Yersinia pseudotuberculosis complex TaxID=1649845 RepID=Q8CL63_YERPE|nr:hypothetical [Yersinia pestis KIM10+]ABG13514.1 conserved hypothetical protein [Yersinia pestis Antiqua]ABG17986.1 conserved hypothetical protein [Yersinia pestis Nepal516]ABP39345.1 conserved hypothetical protein [Yersinia pestis Pestoides F]ABS49830.1 putative membrane protein [Yersinia pseudotuberculosis IP 31758]ADV98423.1 hypothetical protein YPC_1815 [Yersinia pestis biovar Medievalis str. Harbin 35]EDR32424.1 putative membrane protein [Yersinia pestis biovar Orientalis str. IP275]E
MWGLVTASNILLINADNQNDLLVIITFMPPYKLGGFYIRITK